MRVFTFDLKEKSEVTYLTERGREFQFTGPMYWKTSPQRSSCEKEDYWNGSLWACSHAKPWHCPRSSCSGIACAGRFRRMIVSRAVSLSINVHTTIIQKSGYIPVHHCSCNTDQKSGYIPVHHCSYNTDQKSGYIPVHQCSYNDYSEVGLCPCSSLFIQH